jgi:hypothetical protein
MLGFLGPILLLIIGALFAWRGYQHAMQRSSHMVTQRVIQSNKWAARSPAGLVANKIDRYFGAVQRAADDPALRRMLLEVVHDAELAELLRQLNDPQADEQQRQALREHLEQHPARQPLQRRMEELLGNRDEPTEVASWFITDGSGTHLAADFRAADLLRSTIGHNYAYRTYFHGGNADLDPNDRPPPGQHVRQTHLSALLQSTATDTWKVAVSTPIYGDTQTENELIGVLAMTIDLGKFMRFDKDPQDHQLAVLVDGREGPYQGVILQHPLFEELLEERGMSRLPERFSQYRVPIDVQTSDWYRDPLGEDPLGQAYRKRWIVATAKVRLDPDGRSHDEESMQDSGLFVLVMEDYDESLAAVRQLGSTFLKDSVVALLLLSVVVVAMWYIATRRLKEHSGPALRNGLRGSEPTPLQDLTTLAAPRRSD